MVYSFFHVRPHFLSRLFARITSRLRLFALSVDIPKVIFAALLLAMTLVSDVRAQTHVPRIGVIAHSASVDRSARLLNAFRERLREFGYVEGRNIAIDVRYPGDHTDGYRDVAKELVALKVDVIVTANTGATRAAQQQTASIPIVMASVGNAVLAGFVKTLAHGCGKSRCSTTRSWSHEIRRISEA